MTEFDESGNHLWTSTAGGMINEVDVGVLVHVLVGTGTVFALTARDNLNGDRSTDGGNIDCFVLHH